MIVIYIYFHTGWHCHIVLCLYCLRVMLKLAFKVFLYIIGARPRTNFLYCLAEILYQLYVLEFLVVLCTSKSLPEHLVKFVDLIMRINRKWFTLLQIIFVYSTSSFSNVPVVEQNWLLWEQMTSRKTITSRWSQCRALCKLLDWLLRQSFQ